MFNILKQLTDYRDYHLKTNMQRLKMYYEKLFLKHIAVAFGCFSGENMIAADLLFVSKNIADYIIITEKPEKMNTGAQYYLIWKTMNYLREKDIKYLYLSELHRNILMCMGMRILKKVLSATL